MLIPMHAGGRPSAAEARRQRSMSYMLFVMTLMVLFDRRAHRDRMMGLHRRQAARHHGNAEPVARAVYGSDRGPMPGLNGALAALPRGGAPVPFFANITGRYHGKWTKLDAGAGRSAVKRFRTASNGTAVEAMSAIPSATRAATFAPEHPSGALTLHLASQFIHGYDQFSVVRGVLEVRDGTDTSDASPHMMASTQGIFFGGRGRMSLFVNSHQDAKPLRLRWTRAQNGTRSTGAMTVSPGMRQVPGASGALGDGCSFRAELDARAPRKPAAHGSKHAVLNGFSGVMWSPNCANTVLNVTMGAHFVNWTHLHSKAVSYALMMGIICVGQIVLLARQLKYAATPATSARMSLLTVGHQTLIDAYLCLFHLVGGMVASPLFGAFVMVSFLELVLFSVFEMRVLVLIWKARRPAAFNDGWLAMRRELSMLYSRFYCSLMLGIFVIYRIWPNTVALGVVAYSYWLPQIVRNAVYDVRRPLDCGYIVGTSISRLALPLYFFTCPHNMVAELTGKDMAEHSVCSVVVAWTALQAGMLLLQDALGPRFFIPRALRPQRYNYRRRVTLSSDEGGAAVDCAICMEPVDCSERGYLITPCDHVFHDRCLQQWMEVKLECPSCRAQLPALSSEQVD